MTRWLLLLLLASAAHAQDAPAVGDLAPDIKAVTLVSDTLRLGDLRDRHVLVEFWGTWCSPCVADAPRLAALYARHPRDRFEIVGVALDAADDVRAFTEVHGLTWPQIVEPTRDGRPVTEAFGVTGYPTSFVIDPDGVIVHRGDGAGTDVVTVLSEILE